MAFEWDAVTRQTRRSDNAASILGDDEGGPTGVRNEFFERVHPDDRKTFKTQIRKLSPCKPSYLLNFRFRGMTFNILNQTRLRTLCISSLFCHSKIFYTLFNADEN